jgi:hypothetical protein
MTLLVAPNPYLSLDNDGDPCAYVLRVDPSNRGRLVAARRVLVNGKVKIEFEETASLPLLPAYRRHLQNGELLPADEATAKFAGVPWRPLAEQIRYHRAQAVARYQAHHDGALPAWATPEEAS